MKATTKELAIHALHMRINYIETGVPHLSAVDAENMNKSLAASDPRRQTIKVLTNHQVCVLNELREAITEIQGL